MEDKKAEELIMMKRGQGSSCFIPGYGETWRLDGAVARMLRKVMRVAGLW